MNNYICFGSDSDECPKSNLFRIIGVFDDKVKLISLEPATISMLGTGGDYVRSYSSTEFTNVSVYSWNGNTLNLNWGESYLNTVNLNNNFINFLGSSWSYLIDTSRWIVSYNEFSKISVSTISVAY